MNDNLTLEMGIQKLLTLQADSEQEAPTFPYCQGHDAFAVAVGDASDMHVTLYEYSHTSTYLKGRPILVK